MESLAYLHLALAYENSISSEFERRNQNTEESGLKHRTLCESLEFSPTLQNQIKKLVFIFKPKLLVKISTTILALALMVPNPAFALHSRRSCSEYVVCVRYTQRDRGLDDDEIIEQGTSEESQRKRPPSYYKSLPGGNRDWTRIRVFDETGRRGGRGRRGRRGRRGFYRGYRPSYRGYRFYKGLSRRFYPCRSYVVCCYYY